MTNMQDATDVFEGQRPRLFALAYRLLGSAAEAEDVLQDVWLAGQRVDGDRVDEPAAYLTTATTRRCLDVLRSARVRRESYVGPWLPEPLLTGDDVADGRVTRIHLVRNPDKLAHLSLT